MPAAPKKFSFAAILAAYKDTTGKTVFYLDSKTGQVMSLAPNTPMRDLEAIKQRMVKEPDTLVKLLRVTAEENFADMEEFIRMIVDKKLAERLSKASTGGGTLRNFLDALESGAPREKEQWKQFREQKIQTRLKNWLKEMAIIAG